jgi:Cd2+/Zn2+-exporting ATPase
MSSTISLATAPLASEISNFKSEIPPPSPADTTLRLRLTTSLLALALLLAAGLARLLRPGQEAVADLIALAALLAASWPVFWDALTSLRASGYAATKYYMDQLVALAVLACLATGQYTSGAIVSLILVVGQLLEERAVLGVEEALDRLTDFSRSRARLADGTELDAAALAPGHVVRLRPGDLVPADGEIVSGHTTLDEASITGESLPREAGPGASAYAGARNLSGLVDLRVSRAAGDTVLGRVRTIVEEAKNSRAPVMRLIEHYTRYYTPAILLLAAFVLFFTGDFARAVAVVIVSMPCAFVLASPSAMVAALAVAARAGILVKNTRSFEEAGRIGTLVFDKTGTLTRSALRLARVERAPGVVLDDSALLALAAALQQHSTHPVARALAEAARERGLALAEPDAVREEAGLGMSARHPEGELLVGREAWLGARGVALAPGLGADGPEATVHLALVGRHLAAFRLADTLRPEARDALASLRAEGIGHMTLLTGDRPEVAGPVAAALGIERLRARCLPADKLAEVEALKRAGHRVLVVGDGVNDAPALAAGHLGVAMGSGGAEIAVRTADVALMTNDLSRLAFFFRLSRLATGIINQNLALGAALIALFVTLSTLGLISPVGAAVLHEVSAFAVLLNSARLLRVAP